MAPRPRVVRLSRDSKRLKDEEEKEGQYSMQWPRSFVILRRQIDKIERGGERWRRSRSATQTSPSESATTPSVTGSIPLNKPRLENLGAPCNAVSE